MTETVYTLEEAYRKFVDPELRKRIDEANRKMKSAPTIQIVRQGEASDESWRDARKQVDRLLAEAAAQIVLKLKSGKLEMRAYPADRPYQGDPVVFPELAWNDPVVFYWRRNRIRFEQVWFSGVQIVDGAEPLKRDASLSTNTLGRKSTRETSRRIFADMVAQGHLEKTLAAQARQVQLNYPDGMDKSQTDTIENHIREDHKAAKEAEKLPDKDDTL